MNKTLTHISRWPSSEWIVIKVDLEQQGKFMATYIRVRKKGATWSIEQGKESVPSGSLQEVINLENKPVVLVVDGKGVLHKKYHTTSGKINPSAILPNVSIKEFFIQHYPIDEEEGFISVIRKNTLGDVHQFFSDRQAFVVHTYLGPFMTEAVLNEIKEDEVTVFNYNLVLQDQKIIDIAKNDAVPEKLYDLSVGNLNAHETGLYATLYDYLHETGNTTFLVDDPPGHHKEYIFKELVQKSVYAWIAVLFAVLLLNYLFYSLNQSKIEELEMEKFRHQTQLSQLNELQKEFETKHDIFTRSGFGSVSAISLMIDEIMTQLPYQVELLKLEVFPIQNRMRPNEEIEIDANTLRVMGITPESSLVNTWIERMNQMAWIQNIQLKEYHLNDENKGQFILELDIDLNHVLE